MSEKKATSGGGAFDSSAVRMTPQPPRKVTHIRQIDDVMTQEIERLPETDPVFRTEHGDLCYQAIKGLWTRVWDVFQHTVTDLPSIQEADMAARAIAHDPASPESRLRKEQIVMQMIKAFELGAKSAALILND